MALAAFYQDQQLGEIVIDSPPLNLFSEGLIDAVGHAVGQAAKADIRALLVRAEGEVFSGGADVSIFVGLERAEAAGLMSRALGLIQSIEAIPVPVVVLVQGRCFAGALEVALACDVIWAAEGTQIGQLEAIIGAFPLAGGTQRLASRIGASRAAEMVYGAGIYTAEELAEWGLVSRVLPAEQLENGGRGFAGRLAEGPTLAHAATKRILQSWRSGGVTAADAVTESEGPDVIVSRDLQHGVEALRQSGPGRATFTGR
jgi:enoyl-CoA hydratase